MISTDRPGAPSNVTLVVCSSTTAELAWMSSANNNDPVIDYTVYYNTSLDLPKHAVTVPSNAFESKNAYRAVITVLPWRNYTFHVIARNTLGVSDPGWMASSTCQTPPSKPYRHPAGVCTENGKADQLIITWQVC